MKFLGFGVLITLALVTCSTAFPNIPHDMSHQEESDHEYDWGLNVHFFKDGEDSEKDFQEDDRLPRAENHANQFLSLKSSKKCSSDKQCKTDEYCSKYKTCLNRAFPQNKLYEDVLPSETQFETRYADFFQ